MDKHAWARHFQTDTKGNKGKVVEHRRNELISSTNRCFYRIRVATISFNQFICCKVASALSLEKTTCLVNFLMCVCQPITLVTKHTSFHHGVLSVVVLSSYYIIPKNCLISITMTMVETSQIQYDII